MPFWIKFAIEEALTLAELFVNSKLPLNDAQKAAINTFILDAEALLAAF